MSSDPNKLDYDQEVTEQTINYEKEMTMYLCDACIAKLVNQGRLRPLAQIWGANNIPFKKGICKNCGNEDNLSSVPDYEIINDTNQVKEI